MLGIMFLNSSTSSTYQRVDIIVFQQGRVETGKEMGKRWNKEKLKT